MEEQDADTVTMATASFSQRRAEGSRTGREGETRRRPTRRAGETRHSVGGREGGGGAPDLDLDQDLSEEQGEDEAVRRRRRSRTVPQKQKEPGSRSRSSPRSSSPSWDSSPPGEGAEPVGASRERRRRNEKKSRRRVEEEEEEMEEVRDGSPTHNAKASGSSRASAQTSAFSFLRPMTHEPSPLSDSESAASFSEVSQSAASITTASRRENSDWRVRADSSDDESGAPPGPWLKPSPQRLSRVLIGSRHSGQGIMGGLSI